MQGDLRRTQSNHVPSTDSGQALLWRSQRDALWTVVLSGLGDGLRVPARSAGEGGVLLFG